ncbi:MAG: protein kinase [Oscillochloris sp.]|nr:protein kinase [Oscillochloris sp.]
MLEAGALVHQRYQIVRLIGRGGMGAVYEAIDQRLRNTVALKQMLGGGAENIDAFAHEARILASLRHPALPKVIDYFGDAQGYFLVMEFFSGADLSALLGRHGGPFPVADVLEWADQLLAALDYLHRRQPPVLHRDIKPQNLKVTAEGQVVLLDFGLAKGAQASDATSFFGYTLQYAPLEQIEGRGTEPRSDLYALAATLYHLLADRAPPNAPVRADAVLAGRPDPLRPLYELNPNVAPALSEVLLTALALPREQRPVDAVAFRRLLQQAALFSAATLANPAATPPKEAPAVAPPERPISVGWEQVRHAAGMQFDQVLRELAGSARRPGPFIPEIYVHRALAESELERFLEGESGALLLVGDSGVGKTNLLANWAAACRDGGDAVLFYRCGGSLGPEIDREIARDLGRESPDLLWHDLGQIAQLAAGARQHMLIIFDAVNEYRSGASAGAEALLKQIDALVGRLAGRYLRIVLSSNSATWGQFERSGAARLFWSAYHHTADGEPLLRLNVFEAIELHAAYTRHRHFFRSRPRWSNCRCRCASGCGALCCCVFWPKVTATGR